METHATQPVVLGERGPVPVAEKLRRDRGNVYIIRIECESNRVRQFPQSVRN
jgi:hypothetical protein